MASPSTDCSRGSREGVVWVLRRAVSRSEYLWVLMARLIACTFPRDRSRKLSMGGRRSLGVMLAYIRGTTTTTGLTVKAYLDENVYRKSQQVSQVR
jgi:hypothetical protein